jgi:hypothetical protein
MSCENFRFILIALTRHFHYYRALSIDYFIEIISIGVIIIHVTSTSAVNFDRCSIVIAAGRSDLEVIVFGISAVATEVR